MPTRSLPPAPPLLPPPAVRAAEASAAPLPELAGLRVALVHDWLTGRRGAEKVLEELLALFPGATIYTLVHRRGAVPAIEAGREIRTPWIMRLPGAARWFRALLPVLNPILRTRAIRGYDLVISVSHCVAKNARVEGGTPHLCYCQTPVRYAWDLYDLYTAWLPRGPLGAPLRWLARLCRDQVRREDRRGAAAVTRFLAISGFVADRIRRCYGRTAEVIHSPVDTALFAAGAVGVTPGDRFLVVSAVRPNKHVEEVVGAFAALGLPLDVVGDGSRRALRRLRRLGGPQVRVHGAVDDAQLVALVARCRALVHAATEDFGLVPVEAMAAGRGVIGYRGSGLAETVIDQDPGRTGILFEAPTREAIAAAVRRFVALEDSIRPERCRAQAERFGLARFRTAFVDATRRFLDETPQGAPC